MIFPYERMWRKGYLWVTAAFFVISLSGHWIAGWYEFVQEQQEHGQPAEPADYSVTMLRGTLENWQSEFLQLIWQVAGLSFLY